MPSSTLECVEPGWLGKVAMPARVRPPDGTWQGENGNLGMQLTQPPTICCGMMSLRKTGCADTANSIRRWNSNPRLRDDLRLNRKVNSLR